MKKKKYFGIIICLALAIVSNYFAKMQTLISGSMIGLLLGMIVVNVFSIDAEVLKGTKFCAKKVLNFAIILSGATLNFRQLIGYGGSALPILVFNLFLVFKVVNYVGNRMNVTKRVRYLIGSGTCICGGTAIATIASVIKAKEEEIAYAITAIFIFDLLAGFIYPYLSNFLGLSVDQFSVLAGAAINDTATVSAAEATYNLINGFNSNAAITIKLTRTTLLIPLAIFFSYIVVKNERQDEPIRKTITRIFPWFILIFVLMTILNTIGLFDAISAKLFDDSAKLVVLIKKASKFATTVALCGVGFKLKIKDVIEKGKEPLLLGGIAWSSIFVSTLIYVLAFV